MTELTARLVLTGDSTGYVVASGQASAAQKDLRDNVAATGAAAQASAGQFNAASAAIAGQAAASDLATKALSASGQAKLEEIQRLTQLASASSATTASISVLSSAHAAYNNTVNQARTLLASGAIGQADYEKAVQGASAQLALSKVMHDASSEAMTKEMAAASALGVGLQGFGTAAESAALHTEKFAKGATHLAHEAGMAAIPVRALYEVVEGFGQMAMTPVGAFLLTAAAIAVLVAAEQSYEASINKLNVTVQAHGDVLRLGTADYKEFASGIAEAADVSERAGRSMVEDFVNAGAQSSVAVREAAQAVQGYAVLTGESAEKAAGNIAKMFSDPVGAARNLIKEYGLFNDAQLQMIQHLQDGGNKAAAQEMVIDALKNKVHDLGTETTTTANAWDMLGRAFVNAWDWTGEALGGVFSGTSAAKSSSAYNFGFGFNTSDVPTPGSSPEKLQVDPAALARRQADIAANNQLSVAAGDIERGAAYDGKGDQIDAIDRKINTLRQDEAMLAAQHKSTAAATAAITTLEKERAKVIAEGSAALNKVDDEDKKKLDNIKALIEGSLKATQEAAAHAAELQKEAAASDGTAASIKSLQDAYDVSKAIAPYTFALSQAHDLMEKGVLTHAKYDAAVRKLNGDIASLTASMTAEKNAQEELNTKQDVRSKLQGLQVNSTNAPDEAARVRALDLQNLDSWREHAMSTLDQSKADYFQWVADIADIYNNDLAKIYDDDLKRRTDWAAGVQRGLDQINKQTGDMASTSEGLLKSFSTESENEFVKFATGGKNVMQSFFQWLEQEMLKLAYQKLLQAPIDNMFGQLLNMLTGGMGGGGAGGFIGSLLGSVFGDGVAQYATPLEGNLINAMPSIGFHSGGTIGVDYPMIFNVSPALFANAQRYHDGGDILQPGEVPIIAQSGEHVSTAGQWQSINSELSRPIMIQMPAQGAANANQAPVQVNVHNHNGTQSQTQSRQNADGSWSIDILTDQVDRTMAQRNQLGRSQFSQSLENTHGIRRGGI